MTTSTHPLHDKTNPGLATYDITGYTGTRGKNFYSEDRVLQRIVVRLTKDYTASHKKALSENLTNYGQIVGGILDELVDASHKEGKYGEIVKYDRTGVRIDEIKYSFEQKEIRRIAYQFGIVNLDAHPDWKHPFTLFHKMALAYLSNMLGEAGFCCPLAMTDGMIEALKAIGTEEQKKKYLPLVWGKDSASHLMAGQYVTERVGGSNVALNRTVASKGDNGKWVLNGEKWFCSNPGDLWVTTAKIEGTSTIGLFL
ncbi:MAG: acyl-CoA dehydrogenase family protein, partial [Leptospira sp.]|nr:acyl-CoA dehydrogenase family protein [Leptospira sp.]